MWNYFYITTMAEQANQINAMMGVAMGVLVAIAAISLLVGPGRRWKAVSPGRLRQRPPVPDRPR